MHLLVHIWKLKPAWLKLPAKQRATFVARVSEGIAHTVSSGAELLGFIGGDADNPHTAGYTYFAAWRCNDKNSVLEIEQAMAQVGWHDYFEQLSVRGEVGPHDAVLQTLAAAKTP